MTSSAAATNRRTSTCSAMDEAKVKYIPCSRSDLAVDDELEMIIRRSSINIAQDHKNHHDDRTPLSSCRFSFFQRHSTTNLKSSMDDLQANPSPLDPSRLNDRCFNVAMTTSGCSRLETSFSRRSVFLDETWSDKMPRERRSIGSYSMMAGDLPLGAQQSLEPHKSAVDINAGVKKKRRDYTSVNMAGDSVDRSARSERLAGMGLLLPLKKKKVKDESREAFLSPLGGKMVSGPLIFKTSERSPSVDRHSSSMSLLSPDRATSRDGLLEPREIRAGKRVSVDHTCMGTVKRLSTDAEYGANPSCGEGKSSVMSELLPDINSLPTAPATVASRRFRRQDDKMTKEDMAFVNRAGDFKGSASNAVATSASSAATRSVRKQRRKEIARAFGKHSVGEARLDGGVRRHHHMNSRKNTVIGRVTAWFLRKFCCCCLCRGWTVAFDPSGRLAYWWTMIVSLAFIYNFWVLVYRFSFDEIRPETLAVWFPLDYLADFVYALDIAFHFRTGFLDDGVLQTDPTKMRIHYMNSTIFYIDMLCLLPLDFLYLSLGFKSVLRCFRLVKIYRFWEFLDRTERHTNYPNVVRTFTLLHYLFAIFHWNACLVHIVQEPVVSPCVAPASSIDRSVLGPAEPLVSGGKVEAKNAESGSRSPRSLSDDNDYTGDRTSLSSSEATTESTVKFEREWTAESTDSSQTPRPDTNLSNRQDKNWTYGVADANTSSHIQEIAEATTTATDDSLATANHKSHIAFEASTSPSASALHHHSDCTDHHHHRAVDSDRRPHQPQKRDVFAVYLQSLYQSTMVLTTVGNLPEPNTKTGFAFAIFEFVFALLLFATILGHVANIVTSISAARKEFQTKLDSVKTYMTLRRVPLRLQDRVIRWFDYLWLSKKSSDEDKTLSLLPNKLKAEIALHVHLDTLKRVEIFQNTEAGFLCDLVLRLRPVLFSPGDYICRKGEVGKEMYVVNRGRLQVVADNGKTVLATLRPGSYFGEISILNMGHTGNRRTASVRSVGYSDLFCLSKSDLWEVLKDYPTARVRLEAIAVKRMEKYKRKAPMECDNVKGIPKSKSTPGLVESSGKIPLEKMLLRNSRVCSQAKPTISLPFAVAPTGDTNEGVAAATFDDREAEAADQKSAFQSFSSFGERRHSEYTSQGQLDGQSQPIGSLQLLGNPNPLSNQTFLPTYYGTPIAASPISPALIFNSPTPSSASPFLSPHYYGASPVPHQDTAYLLPSAHSNYLHPHRLSIVSNFSVSSETIPVSSLAGSSDHAASDVGLVAAREETVRATEACDSATSVGVVTANNSSPDTTYRSSSTPQTSSLANENVPESANSATSNVHFYFGDDKLAARVAATAIAIQPQQPKAVNSSFYQVQPLQPNYGDSERLYPTSLDVAGASYRFPPMVPQRFPGPFALLPSHADFRQQQQQHNLQQQQQQLQQQLLSDFSRNSSQYSAPVVFPLQQMDRGYTGTPGLTVARLLPTSPAPQYDQQPFVFAPDGVYDYKQHLLQQQQQQQQYVLYYQQQQQQQQQLIQSTVQEDKAQPSEQWLTLNSDLQSKRRSSLTLVPNADHLKLCRTSQRKSLAENIPTTTTATATDADVAAASANQHSASCEVEVLKNRLRSLQDENLSLSKRLAQSESAPTSENSEISQPENETETGGRETSTKTLANHLRAD